MSYPNQNQPQNPGWQPGTNQPNPNLQGQARPGDQEWQTGRGPGRAQGLATGPGQPQQGQGQPGRQPQFMPQGGQQMATDMSQGAQGQGFGGQPGPGGGGYGGAQAQQGRQQQVPGGQGMAGAGQGGTFVPGPAAPAGGQWEGYGNWRARWLRGRSVGGSRGWRTGWLRKWYSGYRSALNGTAGSVEKVAGRVSGDQGLAQRGDIRQGGSGNVGQGYQGEPGNY
ncbi:hypothetical protein NLI96_g3216 [Meripilus lineatus]|uniref:Uncharacterized protein n=1 Tax=Meripilus lineatus TaxID=2056292 RepID=A0AAD5VBY3_9APHY|nr:hypothetical protein NLI96_g3216 [Physisporinus lineatus]